MDDYSFYGKERKETIREGVKNLFDQIFMSTAGCVLNRLLPETLARAMSAGIGLFLAFIGYQASEGIGVVGGNGATLVSLGNSLCTPFLPYDILHFPLFPLSEHCYAKNAQ